MNIEHDSGQTVNNVLYQQGASGQDVQVIQQDLTAAGFPVGVDGQYGPATMQAVAAFQQSKSLPATGTIDLDTFNALAGAGAGAVAPTASQAVSSAFDAIPKCGRSTLGSLLQLQSGCTT